MNENSLRAFDADFGYTEEEMRVSIEKVRGDLQLFRVDLEQGDEPMKNFASRAIPKLEKTLKYVDKRSPAQMIAELKNMHRLIATLESSAASRDQIGGALLAGYRDQIIIYQSILNHGWIETAMQTIAAAKTRQNMY